MHTCTFRKLLQLNNNWNFVLYMCHHVFIYFGVFLVDRQQLCPFYEQQSKEDMFGKICILLYTHVLMHIHVNTCKYRYVDM